MTKSMANLSRLYIFLSSANRAATLNCNRMAYYEYNFPIGIILWRNYLPSYQFTLNATSFFGYNSIFL